MAEMGTVKAWDIFVTVQPLPGAPASAYGRCGVRWTVMGSQGKFDAPVHNPPEDTAGVFSTFAANVYVMLQDNERDWFTRFAQASSGPPTAFLSKPIIVPPRSALPVREVRARSVASLLIETPPYTTSESFLACVALLRRHSVYCSQRFSLLRLASRASTAIASR